MDHSLVVRLFAEFFGTAFLVLLGNGAVANTELKNTKGEETGWLNIAVGYGAGVAIPAMAFGALLKLTQRSRWPWPLWATSHGQKFCHTLSPKFWVLCLVKCWLWLHTSHTLI